MIHIVQVCWSQLLKFFDHSIFSSTQSELFPVILVYCSVFEISPNPYHPFVKTVMCWNECENSLSAGEISVSRIHVCRSDVFSNVHNMHKSLCVLLSLLRKLTTFTRWKNATVERHGHILYHFFVVDFLKNYVCCYYIVAGNSWLKCDERLAWISSDYFESLLLPRLLRGENDSKQSDEIRANARSVSSIGRAPVCPSGRSWSGLKKCGRVFKNVVRSCWLWFEIFS